MQTNTWPAGHETTQTATAQFATARCDRAARCVERRRSGLRGKELRGNAARGSELRGNGARP